MNITRIAITCLLLLTTGFTTYLQGKVYLIPSLHGLHNANKSYSYDSLKAIIAMLKPDIIAVEIRPEDIDADTSYLAKNYPLEMRAMKTWFPGVEICGFDWLGNDIEGKPIPPDYWKLLSPIKKYERLLDQDSTYSKRTTACDSFTQKRLRLLQTLPLRELLASDDASLTNQFYSCLQHALDGSIHERVLAFYRKRNKKMLNNLERLARRNKHKIIVIVTGDDHYVYLKDRINHDKIY